MKMNASSPLAAAYAAVAFARFPVEAQATVSNPNSRATVTATVTTRSLNDPVGLTVSSFSHSSSIPRASPSRRARRSGVNPAPRSTVGPSFDGRSAR